MTYAPLVALFFGLTLAACDSNGSDESLDAPALLTPAENAVMKRGPVTFSWESVERADFYNVEIAANENFGEKIVDTTIETTTTRNLQPLTYYWRVTAVDVETDNRSTSVAQSFTVEF